MRNPQKGEPLFSLEDRAGAHRGVVRAPRQRRGHDVQLTRRRPRPQRRRALHREGPPGRVRLRVGAADGADEPLHLRGRHLFIPTTSSHSFLASKLIRDIARFGGDVTSMVPPCVAAKSEGAVPVMSRPTEDGVDDSSTTTDTALRPTAPRISSASWSRSSRSARSVPMSSTVDGAPRGGPRHPRRRDSLTCPTSCGRPAGC